MANNSLHNTEIENMIQFRRELKLALAGAAFVFASIALSGCVVGAVALAGAGTKAGMMVAEDRTVGEGIDDITIDTKIQQSLLDAGLSEFRRVDVKVYQGRVLLTGVVSTPDARVRASQLAWDTDKVAQVINEIDVSDRNEFKNLAQDGLITTRVRTAFVSDRNIKQSNYGIETVGGRVYLFGEARSMDELRQATEHARAINGVVEVVSYVELQNQVVHQAASQPIETHKLN